MGKIKNILWLLLLVSSADVYSQAKPSSQPQTLRINKQVKDLYVDNLNNYYLITATNQLIKYSANGDSIAAFNDVRKFGSLTAVDVTNPFKILLYYQDYSTLLVLDRFLNLKSTIDFRKQNILQVKAFALSYENNIWLYDELTGKIKKMDDAGNLILESADMRVALGESLSPEYIIDNGGKLYLCDDEKGFFIFDYYGALQNQIPLTKWRFPSVENENIYGLVADAVNTYSIKTHIQHLLFSVNLQTLIKALYKNNQLYLLYPDKIVVTVPGKYE